MMRDVLQPSALAFRGVQKWTLKGNIYMPLSYGSPWLSKPRYSARK